MGLLQELQARKEYITCQKHPALNLLIWNYNAECQYEKKWDEYTMMARGLITDLDGQIVSRPFNKFFNVEETEETKIKNLPAEVPLRLEKLDGSLGIQYSYPMDAFPYYKSGIATRGSFTGEQANWATNWLRYNKNLGSDSFWNGYTYLYEIIYDKNRIVVKYPFEGLVLLAIINNQTGKDVPFIKVIEEGRRLGIRTPKVFNTPDTDKVFNIDDLIQESHTLSSDQEGWVCLYSNGLRVKIKGEEYLRIHRMITGFSSKSIWECLMNKTEIESLLDLVPDEFYQWVIKKKQELEQQYQEILLQSTQGWNQVKSLPDRKTQALEIVKNYKPYSDIIFGMLDNYDISTNIWRRLKPKYELPFKTGVTDEM